MTQKEIQSWLSYWAYAKMVAIDSIVAFQDVYEARRFCSCMRQGVFDRDLVSDLEIWRALTASRQRPTV